MVQTQADADRYLSVSPKAQVIVCGNLKFDQAPPENIPDPGVENYLGPGKFTFLLAVSTHPGEERVVAESFIQLKKVFPDLRLVIVPRHAERGQEIGDMLSELNLSFVRRSLSEKADYPVDVLLADTTGELMGLYAIAESVFVGKSLFAKGSQNMIEPCFFGKRVVVGPHTQNFRPVMDDLLSRNAIIQVSTANEVEETIVKWFLVGDGGLGDRAKNAVQERLGVVSMCVKSIMQELDSAS
jgi:3-deoxy-D-manno-octulosonic-acid transferase